MRGAGAAVPGVSSPTGGRQHGGSGARDRLSYTWATDHEESDEEQCYRANEREGDAA
jgi:hypothetical protein